jgi:hypothetical protein
MEDLDFDRLRVMLEGLPKSTRKTARACWDSILLNDDDPGEIGGIKWAGWAYTITVPKEAQPKNKVAKFAPNKNVTALNAIAATAIDYTNKVTNLNPDLLKRLEEVDPNWKDGKAHRDKLISQAASAGQLAIEEALNKAAPNGIREGYSGRLPPVELMLLIIGRMISFRIFPKTHTLPIARVVHQWVTGKSPKDDWGKRPYDRIKPFLDALDWSNWGDNLRCPPVPPRPPDPVPGEKVLELAKARACEAGLAMTKANPMASAVFTNE